jgi:hypothetical protein
MKNEMKQPQKARVSCLKVKRVTSRHLHYDLFKYMRSRKSECLVVTHLGEPRMIAIFVDPRVAYSLLGGMKELEIEIQ